MQLESICKVCISPSMKIMAGRAEELNKIAASVTANVPDMVGLKGLTAVCQEFTTTLNSLVQGKPFSFEKTLDHASSRHFHGKDRPAMGKNNL